MDVANDWKEQVRDMDDDELNFNEIPKIELNRE